MDKLSKHFINISNRLEIASFVPGVEVQIRGKDENKLEQGQEGEICIRGHDTMKAYL
jgi:acyl-CoA synthetase (AMP-forming)/AMP-acid ligase II